MFNKMLEFFEDMIYEIDTIEAVDFIDFCTVFNKIPRMSIKLEQVELGIKELE